MKKYLPLAIGLIAVFTVSSQAAPDAPKGMKDIKVERAPVHPAFNPYYISVYGANFSQKCEDDHAS